MNKTKKLLSLLLALMMALTLFVPSLAAEEEKTKFVVLGDSIAQGFGLESIATSAYGALISEAEGYEYVNHAIGGHTTYNLNNRLEEPEVIADVEAADIIAVSIGGNNFLLNDMLNMIVDALLKNDYSRMDEVGADFKENFLLALGKIKALNPDATLMIQTLYNPRNDYLAEVYQYAIDIINNTFADILAEQPDAYVLVDVAGAFEGHNEYIQKDKIHPNEAGHYVIAQQYVEALLALGLGTAESLTTEMPEVEQESGNSLLEFFKRIIDMFRNIINTISSFFRGIGDVS